MAYISAIYENILKIPFFENMIKNEVFPIFLEIFANDQKKLFYQKNS